MSDNKELVARIRAVHAPSDRYGMEPVCDGHARSSWPWPCDEWKAADEIERLRAKVERLESRGITDMQHEIERLTKHIKNMAFMSANKVPSPGDTHVESFLPVELWREFRP